MSEEIFTLQCANGSVIDICKESNRDEPDYISWSMGTNCMFGTYANGPELRAFLKKALRHFEVDQRRMDRREARRVLKKYFRPEMVDKALSSRGKRKRRSREEKA
jgi:hypothetical protein